MLANPPAFLQEVSEGDGSLRNDVLLEKYKALRTETGKIPSWDAETLRLFQKTYSSRNRYINKLPCSAYEKSRVKLNVERNPEHCDYINASFLQAVQQPDTVYIASQAPISRTISDFWQMIAEQDVRVIVMLVTADGMKCERYWPEKEGEFRFQTGIRLRYSSIQRYSPSIVIREFELFDGEVKRKVRHYNFLTWPDHDIPERTEPLMELLSLLHQDPYYVSPVLVHCSAGVGRTGTFCVIDTVLRLLKDHTVSNQIDFDPVTDMTLQFRHQRTTIVETFSGKEMIQPGMSGFLVTCFRNCESKATGDAYFLLNRASEAVTEQPIEETEADTTATSISFEDQIKSEVCDLTNRKEKPFLALDTGNLQCIVFVRALKEVNPVAVTEKLFEMIKERSIKSVRFCQRILPVQMVCSAKIEEIRKTVASLIAEAFASPTEYCVVFESRVNATLDRMTVINMIADMVGPKHRVNLTRPQKVIMVQVFKNLCGISVLPSWNQYRKYNAQELLKDSLKEPQQEE